MFTPNRLPAFPLTKELTQTKQWQCRKTKIRVYQGELWTSKQRQASAIHEVSYRACFKPQLPAFFIGRLTGAGETVYDPFSGRGTTGVEAALLGRKVIINDVNPLAEILARPRLDIPTIREIAERLKEIPFDLVAQANIDLSMFYHPKTFREIVSLRKYLSDRRNNGAEDRADRWIRMVATTRLSGHSTGFFSVYTLPPNQAVSAANQIKINRKLNQLPEYKGIRALILRKSEQLQRGISAEDRERLHLAATTARFLNNSADATPQIGDCEVALTVTSPPFLDVVQYSDDNWLRCWFNSIDAKAVARKITHSKTLEDWCEQMSRVLQELYRVTASGGWVAFEVGEVRKGRVLLDEHIVPLAIDAGFLCEGVLINSQRFTKTANIWGVGNNKLGTNANRIVALRKLPTN